ncbi:MAG TPA: hypothetical protein PKA82_06865 [Pyrinomonadaceae bacterium]|nr:hypothetical protein [Pyrinomonadaceae bacterium]
MYFFDEVDFVQTQNMPISELWKFLPIGYLVTILIETPILLIGLSKKLSFKTKLLCGVWLTACTYPIVVIVLPTIFFGSSRALYLLVAEIFAPLAECIIFWFAFRSRDDFATNDWMRCMLAIIVANLASFGLGEVIGYYGWFGLF